LELPNCFYYTSQGGAPQLREFTDEAGLNYTLKAMRAMNWSQEKIESVLKLCAALLHLGQVQFHAVQSSGDDVAAVSDESITKLAAELLGVDLEKLNSAILERVIVTRNDRINVQLSPSKAAEARDSLAKTIYGSLFLWVVSQVNQCITWSEDSVVRSSIGVLDIFGFECFKVNSFEQLCINYTNEALQQQFNKFIFKMEQEEYERENITWAFISFPDNQDCLDAIQSRPNGILTMLDDECRVPKGSDRNWVNRMYKIYGEKHGRISATSMQKVKGVFCVRHFAGNVAYTSETGFLEKNKDEIPITAQTLFETAPSQLMRDAYAAQKKEVENLSSSTPSKKSSGRSTGKSKSKTVAQQFKDQLMSLIEKIESTEPHYIRCLKPNDAAKPRFMTRKRLTEQLRYGGVLEAIRVARMGYPVRLNHSAFFQRYRMLLPSTPDKVLTRSMDGQEPQELCVQLVDLLLKNDEKCNKGDTMADRVRKMQRPVDPMNFPRTDIQLGLTKVFLRKPPHDSLESHRVYHQNVFAIIAQAEFRRFQQETRFLILCAATLTAQRFYRGCVGRARWWFYKRAQCSLLLTNNFRMLLQYRRYSKLRNGTILFQAVYYGWCLRRNLAALKIQTNFRMSVLCKKHNNFCSAVISWQCAYRRNCAMRILADLKKEQKDVGKLKKNNDLLKAEMASLKAMLAAAAREDVNDAAHKKEIVEKEELISSLEKKVAELEEDLGKEKSTVKSLKQEMIILKEETKKQFNNIKSSFSPPVSPVPRQKGVFMSNVNGITASPAVLSQHLSEIAALQRELDSEKLKRRDADGEVIKLRAAMNGIKLKDSDVQSLLPPVEEETQKSMEQQISSTAEEDPHVSKLPPEITGAEKQEVQTIKTEKKDDKKDNKMKEVKERRHSSVTPEVASTLGKLGLKHPATTEEDKPKTPNILKRPSDYFPLIRRGFLGDTSENPEEEEEEVLTVGWKRDFANRKEREQSLRDDVRRFMIRMKRFYPSLEEGVSISLWQLCESDGVENFNLKSSKVLLKLNKRGEKLLQAVLTFNASGGVLSKALGRGDKPVIDPLALKEILYVKAGCVGHDITQLPSSSSRGKPDCNHKHSNLFITLCASPTPLNSSRLYFLLFKNRSARNDLLNGLRGLLADLQIHEGVSISSMQIPKPQAHPVSSDQRSPLSYHKTKSFPSPKSPNIKSPNTKLVQSTPEDITVPLVDVHKAINKQRKQYDRLLIMLLEGFTDTKEKEDELLSLYSNFDKVVAESEEKDKVQMGDSKLIMQLSKKLESLLMTNEDLREQNDRLNTRLVNVECEKMNLMSI